MEKLQQYLPFHFTLFLILGIALQFEYSLWSFGFLTMGFVIILLFVLLFIYRKSAYYFVIVWGCFFYLGVALVYVHDTTNYATHYQYHIEDGSSVVLAIDKVLKPTRYYRKYEASVVRVDNSTSIGKILLNIKKDSLNVALNVDDRIFLKPTVKKIGRPLNPHQFNYGNYLKKQGIYHQITTESPAFQLLNEKAVSLSGIAFNVRSIIQESLQKYSFDGDVYAVINALLLGQRQDISKELMEDYTRAGAIHILAVSGLHVGIILLMLSFLLRPLENIKNGIFIKTILIILLLWMFALVAGLSSSVVRAVTMFTFLSVGMSLKRKHSTMNALIGSMFFLLLIKPLFLFDIGFQLSYLAVFSIIWLQPKIYRIWQPKYKFINKFWQLCTVSIAAQLGILPLSLYYFHQFPGLFMISNLVIVPFLGGILLGGIFIIVLAVLNLLPLQIAKLYGYIISLLNDFVGLISRQEYLFITDIPWPAGVMVVSYLIFISIGFLFSRPNSKNMLFFLTAILLFQGVMFYEKYDIQQKNEFVVFHKNANTLIGVRRWNTLTVYHDMKTSDIKKSKIIRSYKIGEQVAIVYKEGISPVYLVGDQQVFIIDRSGVYRYTHAKNPVVILRQSPKINLQRLIATLKPTCIIADGSNYKSVVRTWEQTCSENKIPFRYTGQNGAYTIAK